MKEKFAVLLIALVCVFAVSAMVVRGIDMADEFRIDANDIVPEVGSTELTDDAIVAYIRLANS